MSGRNALILMCMTLATRTAGAAAVSAVQSPGGLILEDAGAGRARVASADRAAVEVALPAGAEVTALAEVGSGWLAGGTRPVASGERRLWLLRGDESGARELAVPAPSPFAVQRRPVPLVEGSELAGLVWLEGSPAGGMGVRAAAWEDGRWAQADWIARPGKGSQTGLAGVVLRDGSWLVVWSAFDGQDDEIVSARRAGDGWQAPRRVVADNRVPDITPALAVTNQGAIAAWSRFDGTGYSLVRALWNGGGWRELAGQERAALYPEFRGTAGSPAVFFFDARRSGWTALALDSRGRVLRRAEAAGPASDEMPLVEVDADGVRLRAAGSSQAFSAAWESPR